MLARRIQHRRDVLCGRLFDAVAALLGLASEVTFEGQAAIALEAARRSRRHGALRIQSRRRTESWSTCAQHRCSHCRIVKADDPGAGKTRCIAARFHNTLSAAIVEVCCRVRERLRTSTASASAEAPSRTTCCCGEHPKNCGVAALEYSYTRWCPPTTAGISLGQAVIANELLRRG